ncbi:hypothetical protein SAMN02982989_3413 [Xaviernesmea oryzae]|uniref:Uncharacterized protein n=1 Tax=Xaviernesmea oryzae TaxID=464029 RepID=A0A1X7G8K8_9HYPH|nr:hypothetical protein [Xaviernesmea oryzae]SMF65845.1 hypothetical protein SAMN02982989_3413 [Xaviernesmea oryzae]
MPTIDARTMNGGSIIEVDDDGNIIRETPRSELPPEWLETEVWTSPYVTRTDINHGTIQHKLRTDDEWSDGPAPR